MVDEANKYGTKLKRNRWHNYFNERPFFVVVNDGSGWRLPRSERSLGSRPTRLNKYGTVTRRTRWALSNSHLRETNLNKLGLWGGLSVFGLCLLECFLLFERFGRPQTRQHMFDLEQSVTSSHERVRQSVYCICKPSNQRQAPLVSHLLQVSYNFR